MTGAATPTPLPVEYSTPSGEALLTEVRRSYALESLPTCHPIERGLKARYVVARRRTRYIARVYGTRWRSAESVAYEFELLRHLAAKGLAVTFPLSTRDGDQMRLLAAPGGPARSCCSRPPRELRLPGPTATSAAWPGARRPNCTTQPMIFTSRRARFRSDLDHPIDAHLDPLRPFLKRRATEWRAMQRFATALRRRATTATEAGLDWGVCHDDLAADSIHIRKDGVLTLTDFDLAAPLWRAFDLGAAWRMAASQRRTAVWDAFLRGYLVVRALDTSDLDAVPVSHATRGLWLLGAEAVSAASLGSVDLTTERLAPELRFFADWEAELQR